jgi:hypothetical protein
VERLQEEKAAAEEVNKHDAARHNWQGLLRKHRVRSGVRRLADGQAALEAELAEARAAAAAQQTAQVRPAATPRLPLCASWTDQGPWR